MNKTKTLIKALHNLKLHKEAESILKLARASDEKYIFIAYKVLEYLKNNPPSGTIISQKITPYTMSFQTNFIPYNIINEFFKEAEMKTPGEMSSEGETEYIKNGLSVNIVAPISDLQLENTANNMFGNDKKSISAFIESINKAPGRKWRSVGGTAALTNFGRSLNVIIYPSPSGFFNNEQVDLNQEKWLDGLNEHHISVLIHEVAHAIDFRRYGKEINRKDTPDFQSRSNAPAGYLNSTEEIQARLMQIFTSLKVMLLEACPDLNIGDFLLNQQDQDTLEYSLLSAINDGDFIEFKEIIFEDIEFSTILMLDVMKSEKTKRKYTARLFEMFNFFRDLFKLGPAGSGSLQSISSVDSE